MKYITLALGQLKEIVPGGSIQLCVIFVMELNVSTED